MLFYFNRFRLRNIHFNRVNNALKCAGEFMHSKVSAVASCPLMGNIYAHLELSKAPIKKKKTKQSAIIQRGKRIATNEQFWFCFCWRYVTRSGLGLGEDLRVAFVACEIQYKPRVFWGEGSLISLN